MVEKAHVVYLLWDPRNGDIRYVGKTCALKRRLWEHQHGQPEKTYSGNWKRELVREGFCCEWAVVEDGLTNEEANECERWWIAYGEKCNWPLTNLTSGGDGASHAQTAETRAKISASTKGRRGKPQSSETKEKLRLANLGKQVPTQTLEGLRRAHAARWARWKAEGITQSPEQRKKHSEALRGRKASAETRAKMSVTHKERLASPEMRAKLRERKSTPESRAKVSESLMGRTYSPETIERYRQAAQKRWVKWKREGRVITPETRNRLSQAVRESWVRRHKEKEK